MLILYNRKYTLFFGFIIQIVKDERDQKKIISNQSKSDFSYFILLNHLLMFLGPPKKP